MVFGILKVRPLRVTLAKPSRFYGSNCRDKFAERIGWASVRLLPELREKFADFRIGLLFIIFSTLQ